MTTSWKGNNMGNHMYYIYRRSDNECVAKFNFDALLKYYPSDLYEVVIY